MQAGSHLGDKTILLCSYQDSLFTSCMWLKGELVRRLKLCGQIQLTCLNPSWHPIQVVMIHFEGTWLVPMQSVVCGKLHCMWSELDGSYKDASTFSWTALFVSIGKCAFLTGERKEGSKRRKSCPWVECYDPMVRNIIWTKPLKESNLSMARALSDP